MQPIQSLSFSSIFDQWSYPTITRLVAQVFPGWEGASSSSPPSLEAFQGAIDILKRQEQEFCLIPGGQEYLAMIPADPDNPLFYFQREAFLDAYNKREFWKVLPGGAAYLAGQDPDAPDVDLERWMRETPGILALKEFHIRGERLTRIPPEIALLEQLENLMIARTPLMSLPSEFGKLASLKLLYIRETHIRALCPEFQNLQRLEKLDLADNQLENIDPVGELRNLQNLSASDNQISRLPPTMVWGCLKILMLSGNKIVELPESFYEQPSLQYLGLRKNCLSVISEKISRMVRLQSFCLSQNQLKELPDTLGSIGTLSAIEVENNQLTGLPLSLGNVLSLKSVFVKGNPMIQWPSFLRYICTDIS